MGPRYAMSCGRRVRCFLPEDGRRASFRRGLLFKKI